jgi:opacity protein-like surface antigen
MKKLLSTLFILLLANVISAQQNFSFISLQAGPSFPLGKFQGKELPDGGFALTGFGASMEGAWFFKPWLGIGASAGANLHPVDVGGLGYEKMRENPFLKDLIIRSDPYGSFSLYAGFFFHFPLTDKLSLTAKALGGIIYVQTPYQLYKAEYELLGKNWYDITSAGDFDGSFLAGAGLRYDLNDCIGLNLQSDFTYNEMDFTFGLPGGGTRVEEKIVAFVNLAAGVVVKF